MTSLKHARNAHIMLIITLFISILRNKIIYSQLGGVDPENCKISLTISKPGAYALACIMNEYSVPGLRSL